MYREVYRRRKLGIPTVTVQHHCTVTVIRVPVPYCIAPQCRLYGYGYNTVSLELDKEWWGLVLDGTEGSIQTQEGKKKPMLPCLVSRTFARRPYIRFTVTVLR